MTSSINPARLGFLAIYNPSLSSKSSEDDDSLADQIVYYASVTTQARRGAAGHERHERLRQIGLAQGMVEFARGFSAGDSVDLIETERTRVVLHEIEPGWWILSSIDLTRVPLPPKLPTGSSPSQGEDIVEYSTKEVKPAALLIHDLVRAHTLFLLHHDVSLSGLFKRLGRRRFVSVLAKYWDLFLSTWSVIMHGNPIRSVLGGVNVAASGELGIGVGEEDRGSGEREVLEGLVGRIDGLVDLVVARFGEAEDVDGGGNIERDLGEGTGAAWLGTGQDPGSEDGAIFLGVGALTTRSLRDVVYWTEDLYMWGRTRHSASGGRKSFASGTKAPMGEAEGYFLIGLKGTIEEQAPASSSSSEEESASEESATHTRTLHVSLAASTASGAPGQDVALRAVVYVNKPFIFTFLFDQETPSLSSETLYRSLHYQLSPLRRHLLLSTRYRAPRPMDLAGASTSPASSRDARSIFASRRARDTEKTLKTNKGWWIVWSSVSSNHANSSGGKQRTSSPRSSSSLDDDQGDGSARGGDNEDKEVILLRRAGDHAVRSFSVPGRDSTARLAQGIGLDTRGYVETLLSLASGRGCGVACDGASTPSAALRQ
ncbi:unnamed protein product [Parascedosporium putredinis]|uniref:CCZ1/INTU/HSP4 first Longin domain-containing protein n=1 Tax=Parascedosporium putredinis TaxID=1442378 RepID=A0A9P1M975_9PEZI|nr:unnamed protein product [Parascedosporium putredinis]CAI7991362.1 unnamed protein product [Parascedosporium putredinis]